MARNHRRYMKMVNYECPKKGCPFKHIPGADFPGSGSGTPVIVITKHGSVVMGCPAHKVALTRKAMRVKIA